MPRNRESVMLDRLHSRAEAAEALGISLRSLDRLVKDGKLAVTKIGDRRLLKASEIARLIDESTDETDTVASQGKTPSAV